MVVQAIDPAGQCLVLRDAAKGGLPQMAVRGEKSGNNPLAMRVPHFLRDDVARRARANRCQLARVIHHQVTGKWLPLPRRHGEQSSVNHHQPVLRGRPSA